jgi:hypothetical protein
MQGSFEMKLEKDFKCQLFDKKTGAVLLEFDAQQDGDAVFNVGFEGGGVGSGSQAMTIMTKQAYDYKAYQHQVLIDGTKWIITSVRPSVRRKLGATIGKNKRHVYILTLE